MQPIRNDHGAAALAALASAWVLTIPGPAQAQAATATNTLGNMMQSLGANISGPLGVLLVAGAYLIGFALVASGLSRMIESNAQRGDHPGMDAIARIIGGAFLVALPDSLDAGVLTLYNQGADMSLTAATVGAVTNCTGTAASLKCVAQNVGQNLVPVFVRVSFILFFLVGAWMVAHAIFTMANSRALGSAQLPRGTVARLVIGFFICNVPFLMYLIGQTLGVSSSTITATGFSLAQAQTILAYSGPSGATLAADFQELVKWIFVILVMFGVIAVWRGLILLRAFADGNGQGTMGAGMTHIVGGVLLANGKWTTCIIVNTFMGDGLGFC